MSDKEKRLAYRTEIQQVSVCQLPVESANISGKDCSIFMSSSEAASRLALHEQIVQARVQMCYSL